MIADHGEMLNNMTPEQFVSHYPYVYHMATADSWDNISRLGLLSTSALLDLYGIEDEERDIIETQYRPCSTVLHDEALGPVTIRDQRPLPESKLKACVQGCSVSEYYKLLNGKVFFWTTWERVNYLLNARLYRGIPHTVITVDSKKLIERYNRNISLSRINSGAIPYGPTPRGPATFCRLTDWPYEIGSRSKKLKITPVELTVDYAVRDIIELTLNVEIRQKEDLVRSVWPS